MGACCREAHEVNLHWFSPVPPSKSGIADWTAGLLPALASRAQVTVWTQQQEWDIELSRYATIRSLNDETWSWSDFANADCCLYNIGNNAQFHGRILDISRVVPGIVVLHDTSLHDLVHNHMRSEQRLDDYFSLMDERYGQLGHLDAELFLRGQLDIGVMSSRYPFTEYAVEHSVSALVHTPRAFATLTEQAMVPIVYTPLPYRTIKGSELEQTQSQRRLAGEPWRLVLFGHFGWNRRVLALLEALSTLPERSKFAVDIYGEFGDAEYGRTVLTTIEHLHLSSIVTLHGFVSDEELSYALDASHLAINLRYPSMGEASFSQLQIWSHALPTMVTRVDWFASLPEQCVVFVRPESEITDIQAGLRAFLANPDRFARMGAIAHSFLVQQHSVDTYADEILALATRCDQLLRLAVANALAVRVGRQSIMWSALLPGDGGSKEVARKIAGMLL